MEYSFECGTDGAAKLSEAIANACFALEPNDHLIVFDYGFERDLRLDIYKDEDYDRARGEYNLVVVHTSQKQSDGTIVNVDDTEDVYVGNGELERELLRIWEYRDFGLL